MKILIRKNTVSRYVAPIITGRSITVIASKYNRPIPGQSKTASVIIGATYLLTVFFLISIFIADLLYGYFDPRVRTGQ